MRITDAAQQYHERMFPGYESKFLETDPEFIERFDNFAFDEVVNQDDLDDRIRMMAILSVLIGCQGIDEFRAMLPAALNFGVTPVEAKEIVYQSVPYLGIGRVFPFLHAVNEILTSRGIELPLPDKQRPRRQTDWKQGFKRRWTSLEKTCGISGNRDRKRAGTSIAGWPITALAITIPEKGLTTSNER